MYGQSGETVSKLQREVFVLLGRMRLTQAVRDMLAQQYGPPAAGKLCTCLHSGPSVLARDWSVGCAQGVAGTARLLTDYFVPG